MAKDKVVLAYSGGLDTSVCIKWLMEEKGLDVIAMAGDVGQERQDLEYVRQKALQVGADRVARHRHARGIRQRLPHQGACR